MSFAAALDSTPAVLGGETMHVLVVDDDPVQGMLLMLFLERFGVSGMLVSDGEHAVDAAQRGDFALILMDCKMPRVNGDTAARRIRAWERDVGRAPTPIVAVTASAMSDQRRRCLEAGMNEVVLKPYSAQQLGAVVMRYSPVAACRAR